MKGTDHTLWRIGRTTLLLSSLLGASALSAQAARARPAALPGPAPDAPGATAYVDQARKNCVGTARNTTSTVWFTLANGVLSDVYYPTNDTTNVKSLQYVVTDGSSFTDRQTRDMTYTVQALDPQALDCRVISYAKSGRYTITTDYITDPTRNTVVMSTTFTALVGALSSYALYTAYDPTINGNGGGGSTNAGADNGAVVAAANGHTVLVASDTVTATNAVNRSYAVPIYSVLDASTPFIQATTGFAGGASDPLTQLDAAHTLSTLYGTSTAGNVVQGAQLQLTSSGGSSTVGTVTLALGFGQSQSAALGAAQGSLSDSFAALQATYAQQWQQYDATLNPPPSSYPGVSTSAVSLLNAEYYLNANLLKLAEDKTYPGALQAGPALPWGQAVLANDPANTYNGGYREVFARDLYEEWTGLYADGDYATAAAAVNFLFLKQQQPDGSMPRNSLTNGQSAPDSFNTQLDECSYPIVMAYQMGQINSTYDSAFVHNSAFYTQHIKPAADFVISHGPSFGPERWEEQGGYSPSTIAAEIAGLIAAADIATANGDTASAQVYRGVADRYQRSIEGWTVTTNGPLASHPYFIRLSKTGDPNAAVSYNLGNGGPTLDQRSVIDQGFLELVRLGIKSASEITVTESLPVVDSTIMSTTAAGPGWHRYNGDGYGDDATTGHPWAPSGVGTGHVWPVLTGERAEYDLATGDSTTATSLLDTMRKFGIGNLPNPYDSGVGLIPEQDWELPNLAPSPYGSDPTTASIGFANGQPAGSSAPLNWSDGQYVRLVQDIAAGRLIEQPSDTYARYVAATPGQTTLDVVSPADNSATTGTVVVSGTTASGNTVYVSATNTDNNSATTTASTISTDGTFSLSIPVLGGTTVLHIVAVSPGGATADVERSVVYDYTPGTLLFDQSDPSGDDNGPGTYAYPTSGDFHPGAFDILDFQVIDSGATVTFKLQTRDLSPTFGSPLGAQLVDVYVHDPNATTTSTAAAYPQRNYTIAPGAAWSRLLEVQGFGQSYLDASGATVGTITISANQISRYITFSVPKASLGGQPGPGWSFVVTLTGQDGYSPDKARSFAATPQGYQFGVCATASTDPRCTVDPNTVPKVLDTLTPAGVDQATELDYTRGPVVLQGVAIPTSGPGGGPGTATPEVGSGPLLATGLAALLAIGLYRRRDRSRHKRTRLIR